MNFRSRATPKFWELLDGSPEEIQQRAAKQYELFANDPSHPSLHLKPAGRFWSVRITDSYRALALRTGDDFVWVWTGSRDDYQIKLAM